MTDTTAPITASVVICAYTERRWQNLCDSVQSVLEQTLLPTQLMVVIDHNDVLLQRCKNRFGRLDPTGISVSVIANANTQGLSGARNTAVEASSGDVVAFLDDDASADPRWLESLKR